MPSGRRSRMLCWRESTPQATVPEALSDKLLDLPQREACLLVETTDKDRLVKSL